MTHPFFTQIEHLKLAHHPTLTIFKGRYQLEHYTDVLFNRMQVTFPEFLNKAVNKRRAEYLAGRYLAQQALRHINIFDQNVATNIDRSPIWPEGIIGSITHTNDYAYVALAPKTAISYVGIDCEKWLSKKVLKDIFNTVATEQEQSKLSVYNDAEQQNLLTLLFSAKESLFKALYPQVKCYFDFLDAEMMIDSAHFSAGEFRIKLLKTLCSDHQEGAIFQGKHYKIDQHILTILCQ